MSGKTIDTVSSRNRDALMGFVGGFLAGDLDGALKHVHPDVVAHEPDSLPYGGHWRGKDGFRALMAKIHETVQLDATPAAFHEAPDTATIVAIYSATFTAHSTGRSVTMEVAEVYGFTDGLLSSANLFYKDAVRFVKELGLD